MEEKDRHWVSRMVEFLTLGRGLSEVPFDAWRLKVNGLSYQEIAHALKLSGKRKQELHNKAKRLIDQARRAGLPDPDKVAVKFKDDAQRANLRRIRPKDYEVLPPSDTAELFAKQGLTRELLAEVLEEMKRIEEAADL